LAAREVGGGGGRLHGVLGSVGGRRRARLSTYSPRLYSLAGAETREHPGDEVKFVRYDGFVLAFIEGALVFVEYEEGATPVFIAIENVDVGNKSYFLTLNKSTFTALGLVKKPEVLAAAKKAPSAKARGERRQMKLNIVKGTNAAVGETVSLLLDTFEAVTWRAVVTKKLRKPFPAAAGAGAADDDDNDYDEDADDDDEDDEVEGEISDGEVNDLLRDTAKYEAGK
jgi:hypothetical protein